MNALILLLLGWIVGQTGLAMPPPPAVESVAATRMRELTPAFGRVDAAELVAVYNVETRTVYLRDDWNPDDLRSRATLLHELVHHVQVFNHVPARCAAERELLAYRLTLAWLREQGVADPYAMLNVDEFTIRLAATCPG